jgi:hypothetical protein
MSDLPPPPPPAPPPPHVCPNCGAPAGPDQDWCLNCGAAITTQVAGATGWRTPLAIVAAVLLIAAAALIFAFVELSGEADKAANKPIASAPTGPSGVIPTPTTAPPTGPSGPTGITIPTGPSGASGPSGPIDSATPSAPSPTPAESIGRWPDGKDGYTVILFSETSYSSAKAKARTVSGLPDVGILDSDKFSSLRGGYYVVFSGEYDSLARAEKEADSARSQAPGAYAKQVTPK